MINVLEISAFTGKKTDLIVGYIRLFASCTFYFLNHYDLILRYYRYMDYGEIH